MTPSADDRLSLPEVTLLAVDTRTPALALEAMRLSMAQVAFADAVLLTDPARTGPTPVPGVRVVPAVVDSVAAYSTLMLRGLLPHVATRHVLVVQWDGYVRDARAWLPSFLDWDYIGAPWHDRPPGRSVGNGGFSLRSRRLLEALQDPLLPPGHPEDLVICERHRQALEQRHGIRIAPHDLARRFAFERLAPVGPTFGFHGLFNFDRLLDDDRLLAFVETLPDAMLCGLDGHDLCRGLIRAGRLACAEAILGKRWRAGLRDRRTWRLRWWLWRARRHAGPPPR